MDDSVNRAASRRTRLSLAVVAITCASGQASAQPADGFCAPPSASTAQDTISQGDSALGNALQPSAHGEVRVPAPQRFLREPDEQEMPWSVVSIAETAPPQASRPAAMLPAKTERMASVPTLQGMPAPPQTVMAPHQVAVTSPQAIPLTQQTPMQRASAIKVAERASALPSMQPQTTFREGVIDFASLRLVEDDSSPVMHQSHSTLRPESQSQGIMPGFSIEALRRSAAKSLDEANARLMHRASLSAAAASTEALRLTAHSNDLLLGTSTASEQLRDALMAIREADDFAGRYGTVDSAAIARMVNSHHTKTLKEFDTSQLTGIIAADIYLDSARQMLEAMAASDPLAAHAIALLAKSYRQRASESPLALATSVHLMRAAVATAPGDRALVMELASVLDQANMKAEAQALQGRVASLPVNNDDSSTSENDPVIAVVTGVRKSTNPSQAQQAVRIEQISPEAFAMVSVAEAGPTGTPSPTPAPRPTNQSLSSNDASETGPKQTNPSPVNQFDPYAPKAKPAGEGNAVSRAFKSMTRIWR